MNFWLSIAQFLLTVFPATGGFKGVAKRALAPPPLGLNYLFYKEQYYYILIVIIKYRQWS
jgi:hypothetical protein